MVGFHKLIAGLRMAEIENDPTPEEYRAWLQQEVRDLKKVSELRIQEATEFVNAFSEGKIKAEQAEERLARYFDRWGNNPLTGVTYDEHTPNEEIARRMEAADREESMEDMIKRRRQETHGGKKRYLT
jgi:hypothetical protein